MTMAPKKPARRAEMKQMSHDKPHHNDTDTSFRARDHELGTATGTGPSPSSGVNGNGNGAELVVIEDGGRLSPAQRRTAQDLLRLYRSLCGGQPGQYWPQALLDTSGGFTRPPFPTQERG
jgi:hypothetical protein